MSVSVYDDFDVMMECVRLGATPDEAVDSVLGEIALPISATVGMAAGALGALGVVKAGFVLAPFLFQKVKQLIGRIEPKQLQDPKTLALAAADIRPSEWVDMETHELTRIQQHDLTPWELMARHLNVKSYKDLHYLPVLTKSGKEFMKWALSHEFQRTGKAVTKRKGDGYLLMSVDGKDFAVGTPVGFGGSVIVIRSKDLSRFR